MVPHSYCYHVIAWHVVSLVGKLHINKKVRTFSNRCREQSQIRHGQQLHQLKQGPTSICTAYGARQHSRCNALHLDLSTSCHFQIQYSHDPYFVSWCWLLLCHDHCCVHKRAKSAECVTTLQLVLNCNDNPTQRKVSVHSTVWSFVGHGSWYLNCLIVHAM